MALPQDWAGEEKPMWWPTPLCWAVQGLLEATLAACGGETSGKLEIKVQDGGEGEALGRKYFSIFMPHLPEPTKIHPAPQNRPGAIN